MEHTLRKSGAYGLLLGIALSILFVDYKSVTPLDNGSSVTTYKSGFEYIVTILRFGIIGMFIGLFISWKDFEKKNNTEKKKSYYLEFFIAFFLTSIFIMFALNW
ncbi:hypothetical protein B0H99_1072 [Planomicrobium soli]|uniref:Uncharacterized protein n=1 Tax=Planomicrobium soli TaxID=1176648 RepID=A0A2P8GQD4_9BACL|nr:hypothetical protein [Planomicrobium soli]PSL36181.1 hypothetical protein B0H99_1072 [Planomicrobium soli]